jgi:hypothetical protein
MASAIVASVAGVVTVVTAVTVVTVATVMMVAIEGCLKERCMITTYLLGVTRPQLGET